MTRALLILCIWRLSAAELPPVFFRALHAVETGGRKGAVLGDRGRALGPLQIHYGYWLDSGVPGRYEDCADYGYSCRVVNAYLRAYAPRAVKRRDYQTLARVHNGGPDGARKTAAKQYWRKVKACLTRQHNL